MTDHKATLDTWYLEFLAGRAPAQAPIPVSFSEGAAPSAAAVSARLAALAPAEHAESLGGFVSVAEGIALGRREAPDLPAFFAREERWIAARSACLGVDAGLADATAARGELTRGMCARTCAESESPAVIRHALGEALSLQGPEGAACAGACAAKLRAVLGRMAATEARTFLKGWSDDLRARARDARSRGDTAGAVAARDRREWEYLSQFAGELADSRVRADVRRLGKALLREVREDRLRERLERLLGPRGVRALDDLVLLLIVLVAGMLVWEARFRPGPETARLRACADGLVCAFLLADFTFRLCLAGPWYFKSHALLGFFPALPYSLLFADAGLGLESIPMLRFLAFFQVGSRAAVVLRPLLGVMRLVGFLAGGLDRLVQALRPLLDHEVMIAGEEHAADAAAPTAAEPYAELQARYCYALRIAFRALAPDQERRFLAAYAWCLGAIVRGAASSPPAFKEAPAPRPAAPCTLRELAARLRGTDPVTIELTLGPRLTADIAAALRRLDILPFRCLPLLGGFARAGRSREPSDAVHRAAQALAVISARAAGAVELYADFRGVGTGPQLLDRVATFVVVRARRYATRFLLVGSLFLAATVIVHVGGIEILIPLANWLGRFLGIPIVALGVCSAAAFSLGLYLKSLAGEALETWRTTAEAQFMAVGQDDTAKDEADNRALLEREVLADERRVLECAGGEVYAARAARVERIYRVWRDGALLHEGDVKLAEQLLGNVAVQQLRGFCLRESGRARRRREARSLAIRSGLLFRPQYYFRLLVDTCAVEVAKLIVDYDRHAIPCRELPHAGPEERERLLAWLQTPAAGHRRRGTLPWHTEFLGCFFTARHFLSPDPDVLLEVEREFGPRTAARLRADRTHLIRELFGVWPFATIRINPYRAYMRHVRSFRILLLPLRLMRWSCRGVCRVLRRTAALLREIYGGSGDALVTRNVPADFGVARRKILRMRRALLEEATELRALVDAEYLGVTLPGIAACARPPWLGADAAIRDAIAPFLDRRARAAQRDAVRFRRLLAARGWDGRTAEDAARTLAGGDVPNPREAVRACFMAYSINFREVKTALHAEEILREFFGKLRRDALPESGLLTRVRRGLVCAAACCGRAHREAHGLYDALAHMIPEGDLRARLFPAFLAGGAEIRAAARLAVGPVQARRSAFEGGLSVLARTARTPAFASEQLVTARTLHSLAQLDILRYFRIVAAIGEYGEAEDARADTVA